MFSSKAVINASMDEASCPMGIATLASDIPRAACLISLKLLNKRTSLMYETTLYKFSAPD